MSEMTDEWVAPQADLSLSTSRIVIIDDVEETVTLLRRILAGAGLGLVDTFTDSKKGLESCLESPPDLLLLDLHMPGLNGLKLLEQLQDRLAYDVFLPVIVLTGDATAETKRRALAAGAKDFLTKPYDRVEVVFRVRNTLETAQFYKSVSQHNRYLQRYIEERTKSERQLRAHRKVQRERIDQVISANDFSIVFQPICDLSSNRITGFESLSRFPGQPQRTPDKWFADATDVGMGPELELLAVRKAIEFLPDLPQGNFISVNVSPAVATQSQLVSLCAVDPGHVVVELTEHTQVDDYAEIIENLNRLRELGVRIAVDDTGAGFAGLEFLVRLRPDVIKLDRSLVAGIDGDPAKRAMAAALVLFAREIGATVIGEGIETTTELQILTDLGCDWGQGFLLGVPSSMSAELWPEEWSVSKD